MDAITRSIEGEVRSQLDEGDCFGAQVHCRVGGATVVGAAVVGETGAGTVEAVVDVRLRRRMVGAVPGTVMTAALVGVDAAAPLCPPPRPQAASAPTTSSSATHVRAHIRIGTWLVVNVRFLSSLGRDRICG